MGDEILLGRGNQILTIPQQMINSHLEKVPEHSKKRLAFMTTSHHEVRNYVVREMPRQGKPIFPERISQDLAFPIEDITMLLDDLERNLFFLVRSDEGAVSWAFPVTTDQTPHRIAFASGERIYGA